MAKNFQQITTDIENRVYYPVYFLYGAEPFYIDRISDLIEKKVLDDSEKEFNLSILYGNEVSVHDIISASKRFPMMANHQVIIVKEAQNLSDKQLEEMDKYLENPVQSTLLVFCYKEKKIDKRKRYVKLLDKVGVLFESEKIKDFKLSEWATLQILQLGYSIEPNAAVLISESIGNDLSRIYNEIEKLSLNLPKGTRINADHIEMFIGISKEFNVYELQNAIGKKDNYKAMKIVNNFAQNPKDHPIFLTINSLFGFFQKLLIFQQLKNSKYDNRTFAMAMGVEPNPYIVKEYEAMGKNFSASKLFKIFSLLRQYDAMAKGVNNVSIDQGELLKEMILKILIL